MLRVGLDLRSRPTAESCNAAITVEENISDHKSTKTVKLSFGSGYFASRGKIAPSYFAIWRQNSPNGYFAASAIIALSLILTQTLTQTLTLIPTLALTQTEEKHYFASVGKIATS